MSNGYFAAVFDCYVFGIGRTKSSAVRDALASNDAAEAVDGIQLGITETDLKVCAISKDQYEAVMDGETLCDVLGIE